MNPRLQNTLPTLAIMLGASVWGLVWYPMRMLAALGLSGTAASATTSAAACLFVLVLRRHAIRSISWHWLLVALALAAGVTNIGFVWGAIHGQVMRVLLLFYLTPAWTALFAHFILHERLTKPGVALAALSLAGAMTMLWSPELGVPLPANLAEWAGLMGGMGFAMSNVLIVKISRVLPGMKAEMRTATIFGGAALVATFATLFESMPTPPAASQMGMVVFIVIGLGVVLASNNILVQVGAGEGAGQPGVDHHAVRTRRDGALGVAFRGRSAGAARVGGRRVHRRRVRAVELGAPRKAVTREPRDEPAEPLKGPAGKKKSTRAMV